MLNRARVLIDLIAKSNLGRTLSQARTDFQRVRASGESAATGISSAWATLGAGLAAGGILKFLVNTNVEFEKLNVRLRTFSANQQEADATFGMLRDFAVRTPFELANLVEAYTTLRSAGLRPTTEMMAAFGDQASAMGRDIKDMADAVRAATTGEMERLKQFGVTARLMGDQVTFSFKGVETTVRRDAKSIAGYLTELSKNNFAGAMEREAKTLGGAISNLKDAFFNLGTATGEAGFTGAVTKAVLKLTEMLNVLREVSEIQNDLNKQGRLTTEVAIMEVEEQIARMRSLWTGGVGEARSRELEQQVRSGQAIQFRYQIEERFVELIRMKIGLEAQANAEARKAFETNRAAAEQARAAAKAEEDRAAAAKARKEAEAANKAYLGELAAAAELVELGVRRGDLLLALEDGEAAISRQLNNQTLSLERQVELTKLLGDVQGARAALGPQRPPPAISMTPTGTTAPLRLRAGAGPAPLPALPAEWSNWTFFFSSIKEMGAEASNAIGESFASMGGLIEQTFASIASGMMSTGEAMTAATGSFLSTIARKLGDYFFAMALGGKAQGFLGIPTGFAASAAAMAAGAAMYAVAGGISGSTRSFGGGRSAGGAFGSVPVAGLGGAEDMGSVTINLPGGILDLTNPAMARAWAEAVNSARGRRLVINAG